MRRLLSFILALLALFVFCAAMAHDSAFAQSKSKRGKADDPFSPSPSSRQRAVDPALTDPFSVENVTKPDRKAAKKNVPDDEACRGYGKTWNFQDDGPSASAVAAACGRLIASKRFGGKDLALLYAQRGRAYSAQIGYLFWQPGGSEKESERLSKLAAADFNEAIRLDPSNIEYLKLRASNTTESDRIIADYTEVIRLMQEAGNYRPQAIATAYGTRGDAYEEKHDFDHALADYQEADRLNPAGKYGSRIVELFRTRAGEKTATGEIDGAIAVLNEALALKLSEPARAGLFNERAALLRKKGDADGALADLGEAIKAKPANEDMLAAYKERIALLKDKGDVDALAADLAEAMKLKLSDADRQAFFFERLALVAKSNPDAALDELRKAIEERPGNLMLASLYAKRAELWKAKGNFDGAIFDSGEAIRNAIAAGKRGDDLAVLYLARAALWKDNRQTDDAIADIGKALEANPSAAQAAALFRERAALAGGNGDRDKAIADLNETLRRTPEKQIGERVDIYGEIAALQNAKGDRDAAIKSLTSAFDLDPAKIRLRLLRANAYKEKAAWREATDDLRAILALPARTDDERALQTEARKLQAAIEALRKEQLLKEQAVVGEWTGEYTCAQGKTSVNLVVAQANPVKAVFYLYPHAENSASIPEGCWAVAGNYDPATENFTLKGSNWIVQPSNYVTVDLTGKIDPDGKTLSGKVTGPGCTTFSISKTPSNRTRPQACQEQIRKQAQEAPAPASAVASASKPVVTATPPASPPALSPKPTAAPAAPAPTIAAAPSVTPAPVPSTPPSPVIAPGKRVALVIGNSAYQHVARLPNPKNDAKLIADALKGLGFTLVGNGAQLDLDKSGFDNAVRSFGRQVLGADVGLFYYAGHGVQLSGSNYLLPVGANPTSTADVDFEMVDVQLVLRQMESAGTKLNLVLLDACRNNPFGGRGMRGVDRGLAQMRAPEGTLISFATQPGNVAEDGDDGNSPYTKALAQIVKQPDLDIFQTFNAVGLAVKRATVNRQQPWVSSSPIDGSFYFAGKTAR